MKYSGFLLIIIFFLLHRANSQNITFQNKIDIYVQIFFKSNNTAFFSYLDSNYHNSVLKIENKKPGDSIIVRKITSDKPTVLSNSEIINNRIYYQLFIGFNDGDTISFEFNNNKLNYIGKDKRNYIVNKIFGKIDLFKKDKELTIQEVTNQQTSIENVRSKQLNELANLIFLYPIDTCSINTIKKLIDLYYYYDLFKIDFSKDQTKNWVNPNYNKLDSLDKKTQILSTISSQYSNSIFYYLIQYDAYLNNSQNTDIFENVQYLDPRFYRTKRLNGFLLDFIDLKTKTYEERERVLAKLKDYMLNNSEPLNYTKKMIGSEVNKASFISFSNKKYSFSDFLKMDKKIIVFDFWASWCEPCISEIPNYKRLIKKLPNVKFISISLDKDSQKWNEACYKYDMKFNSFRILNLTENELLKYFGIRSIPRFIVMTNNGEVLSDDFYRPSNLKFEVDLKRILEACK